jgi:hypothetical protein
MLSRGEFDVPFAFHESPQNGVIDPRPKGYRISALF